VGFSAATVMMARTKRIPRLLIWLLRSRRTTVEDLLGREEGLLLLDVGAVDEVEGAGSLGSMAKAAAAAYELHIKCKENYKHKKLRINS
jgi:hypothetical protein